MWRVHIPTCCICHKLLLLKLVCQVCFMTVCHSGQSRSVPARRNGPWVCHQCGRYYLKSSSWFLWVFPPGITRLPTTRLLAAVRRRTEILLSSALNISEINKINIILGIDLRVIDPECPWSLQAGVQMSDSTQGLTSCYGVCVISVHKNRKIQSFYPNI